MGIEDLHCFRHTPSFYSYSYGPLHTMVVTEHIQMIMNKLKLVLLGPCSF